MFYIRSILIIFWFILASFLSLILCFFRWGDLNLDRDIARLISGPGLKLAGIRVEIENETGVEAHQPCIYVGNHQSGMDLLLYGSLYPKRTIVIGKREVLYIPFFGLAFAASGNIMINRKDRAHSISGLNRAIEAIQQKKASIFIFPEGTRNRSQDVMLPFKKGAFHMAIEAQVPIVPIVCQLQKNSIGGWSQRKLKSGTIRFKVLEPVSTVGLNRERVDGLLNQVRDKMLSAIHSMDLGIDLGMNPGMAGKQA